MKQIDEDYIQNQAFLWFNNEFCLKHHEPRLLFYSVANEIGASTAHAISAELKFKFTKLIEKVLYRILNKFKLTGFKKGVADVHLCFPNGKLVYIEFKTPTGVQRPEQKEFQQRVEALGFNYYIVRSLGEFKEICTSHI